MRKLLIGLMLLAAPKIGFACDLPGGGPYDEPGSHAADSFGGLMAWLPVLFAAGACGTAALPVDVYWKVKSPQDDLGTHFGNQVCVYPAAAAGYSAYLISGFPLYAVKKVVWDVPRSVFGAGDSHVRRRTET